VSPEERARLAQLAALWVQGVNRRDAQVLAHTPSGWRNARLPDQKLVLDHEGESVTVLYHSLRDGSFRFADGSTARLHHWSDDAIDIELGGRRTRAHVTRSGDQLIVQGPNGDVTFTERPRFTIPGAEDDEGGFIAKMPGKVIELRVAVGDHVSAGDTVLVLEAMKMEHPMRAHEDGRVTEVRVAEGDQVEVGTLLLVVQAKGDGDSPSDNEPQE
jgi:propionyl-CoA carboxylase alpha chain